MRLVEGCALHGNFITVTYLTIRLFSYSKSIHLSVRFLLLSWIEFDDQVAIFCNRVVTDFDTLAHPVLEWFLHYGVCDIRYPLLRKTSDISLIWKVMCYFRTFLAFFEDVVDRQTLVLRNEDSLNVFRFDIYIH